MSQTRTDKIELSKPLLHFSDHRTDVWTIDDATKGTSIIGGTGSGKTTASGKQIAMSFLKEGWGGLVLCAKTDEADLWRQYCKKAGRLDDLIVFHRGSKVSINGVEQNLIFNPIDYELKREGIGSKDTQNITNIFMNIYRMGNRIAGEGDVKEERFWDSALKRCLNRTIELIKLSGQDLSYRNMIRVMSTSKKVTHEIITDYIEGIEGGYNKPELELDAFYCLKCLVDAHFNIYGRNEEEKYPDPAKVDAFMLVEDYFTDGMEDMGEKTRGIVMESFLGLAEPFLGGILAEHFSGTTNFFPECIYKGNKIVVLDFPIKEFLDAGIVAQTVFKLMFQQAIERRKVAEHPVPAFLWCDEAQYFVNPYDQLFLTTARGARVATVYLSQNISNYYAALGKDAESKVNSLMGNLSTKIFHANSDAATNEYASKLIGMDVEILETDTTQHSAFSLTNSYSQAKSQQYHPQVKPKEFFTLLSGGDQNDQVVQAIIAMSGKTWSNGTNYLEVNFKQDFS